MVAAVGAAIGTGAGGRDDAPRPPERAAARWLCRPPGGARRPPTSGRCYLGWPPRPPVGVAGPEPAAGGGGSVAGIGAVAVAAVAPFGGGACGAPGDLSARNTCRSGCI